jgi:hypothetical protein
MGDVVEFKTKELVDDTQQDGAELRTLSRDTLINVFFPGSVDWETIVVQTTIHDICKVIKSEPHQHATWHAVMQLDEMRGMYSTAAGTGGKFGSEGRLVDVQIGLATPEQ